MSNSEYRRYRYLEYCVLCIGQVLFSMCVFCCELGLNYFYWRTPIEFSVSLHVTWLQDEVEVVVVAEWVVLTGWEDSRVRLPGRDGDSSWEEESRDVVVRLNGGGEIGGQGEHVQFDSELRRGGTDEGEEKYPSSAKVVGIGGVGRMSFSCTGIVPVNDEPDCFHIKIQESKLSVLSMSQECNSTFRRSMAVSKVGGKWSVEFGPACGRSGPIRMFHWMNEEVESGVWENCHLIGGPAAADSTRKRSSRGRGERGGPRRPGAHAHS